MFSPSATAAAKKRTETSSKTAGDGGKTRPATRATPDSTAHAHNGKSREELYRLGGYDWAQEGVNGVRTYLIQKAFIAPDCDATMSLETLSLVLLRIAANRASALAEEATRAVAYLLEQHHAYRTEDLWAMAAGVERILELVEKRGDSEAQGKEDDANRQRRAAYGRRRERLASRLDRMETTPGHVEAASVQSSHRAKLYAGAASAGYRAAAPRRGGGECNAGCQVMVDRSLLVEAYGLAALSEKEAAKRQFCGHGRRIGRAQSSRTAAFALERNPEANYRYYPTDDPATWEDLRGQAADLVDQNTTWQDGGEWAGGRAVSDERTGRAKGMKPGLPAVAAAASRARMVGTSAPTAVARHGRNAGWMSAPLMCQTTLQETIGGAQTGDSASGGVSGEARGAAHGVLAGELRDNGAAGDILAGMPRDKAGKARGVGDVGKGKEKSWDEEVEEEEEAARLIKLTRQVGRSSGGGSPGHQSCAASIVTVGGTPGGTSGDEEDQAEVEHARRRERERAKRIEKPRQAIAAEFFDLERVESAVGAAQLVIPELEDNFVPPESLLDNATRPGNPVADRT
ncbi:hypothetical protein B0H17DRAFT_1219545 [Mycena rosella]|uniref:Uncharacterized protein n=1 Tax=Mycena rosella TaxID=1033263 RepID=A0AAD7BH88_MYCRO|nr:hypothetical protein B0H17DRAFT_1219545 [Mycena rosella]